MSNTASPIGGTVTVHLEPGSGVEPGAGLDQATGGFRSALDRVEDAPEPSLAREMLTDAARSIGRGQAMVDRVIRAARRGRVFSQEELIAIQAGVYRYGQELEIAAKLVDKASSAVRQTLTSQQ